MADEVILNNLSDDAQAKQYISDQLMPQVFHDIPLNVLNTGLLSLVNEYMSQGMEQMAFTQAFYHNESFITKAALPDSIYSEAAIFNIGYSYATPSVCNFLLELRIEDIKRNAVKNADNGLYEFILDKNTKFNMLNGSVYSLDYDILIQFMNPDHPVWNIQYIDTDDMNSIAVNKNRYILYRVAEVWLCLFVQASEFERQTHTIVNNMTDGIPNEDAVISCTDHIAGFDIKYVDNGGNERWIPHDHILPIHVDVKDQDPYVHYIMDSPQTIRFMFQLNGNRYWIPKLNSHFEITIYTCHGKSANFTAFDNTEQPTVVAASNRFANNGNVQKAAFIISPSMNGTDIGSVETTRRETIEAYNTANVISTDHDIEEWFKTFYFKNILYPYFFKRRDDPWGRVWSGFIALKDTDDTIFRTNTLHARIPYRVLYNNNDNTLNANEIIIPPGWTWVYADEDINRYTVIPYTDGNGIKVEKADTLSVVNSRFVFANPFGIRIQKDPFAIGYFNPWINEDTTSSHLLTEDYNHNYQVNDRSIMYHATPLIWNIRRSYLNDYYNLTTYISPTVTEWVDGTPLAKYVRKNVVAPTFSANMWSYFKQPKDLYALDVPILRLDPEEQYLPFNPENTYFCVREKNRMDVDTWSLKGIWIEDGSSDPLHPETILVPITGDISMVYGSDEIWGENGIASGVAYENSVEIGITPQITDTTPFTFSRVEGLQYYEMRMRQNASLGAVSRIVVQNVVQTDLTKYGESNLWLIGTRNEPVQINVWFSDSTQISYTISNAYAVYMPYEFTSDGNGGYEADLSNVGPNGIILYADMKAAPMSNAYDHYKVKFADLPTNIAMFYLKNNILPMPLNNMRVMIEAYQNGTKTGWVEMQPVELASDGSYRYEVSMYPLTEMVDVDSRIQIASTENGGGSWTPTTRDASVSVDATEPDFVVTIFIRVEGDAEYLPYEAGDPLNETFKGFRVVDQYHIDDISLVQELKEMRSVVKFGESTEPTPEEIQGYDALMKLSDPSPTSPTVYDIREYFRIRSIGETPDITFNELKNVCDSVYSTMSLYQFYPYSDSLTEIYNTIEYIGYIAQTEDDVLTHYATTYEQLYELFSVLNYKTAVDETFARYNVNGGVEVQLVPFVSQDLMVSDRFMTFVSSFTQVHKAIEPVIFTRLEGNNYLDCKLIATYGLPHSYCADINKNVPPGNTDAFWPDLNVQIAFDVKLYNNALDTNTCNELRQIIHAYFNRLTTIHKPDDIISMNNNIYVSQLIQQMESHDNVAYLKFKGWYTTEKNDMNGHYMNADYQAIVQKWDTLEKMPTDELERFVPEMFVLTDDNIILNIL